MARKVITYRKDLLDLEVGDEIIYPKKFHRIFMSTKSQLKKDGLGEWEAKCGKNDTRGKVVRIK